MIPDRFSFLSPVTVARVVYTQCVRQALTQIIFNHGIGDTLSRCDIFDSSTEHVIEISIIDQPELVTLSKPLVVGSLPETVYNKINDWKFDRSFVATLQNIQIVGPNALPITSDGAYILEVTEGSSLRVVDELIRTIGARQVPVRRSPGHIVDTVIPMVGPWSQEFFHWFADYLPRLRQIEQLYGSVNNAPPLLVPSNAPNWLQSSLDLLGVDEENRIQWHGGRMNVRQFVIPSLPRHVESTKPDAGYIQSPRAMEWVSSQLRSAVDMSDRPDVGRRLYVSRANQSDRRVINEANLRSVLSSHGFDIIHPENWSLEEQVAAFAQSEAVCGPHGAGLINFVYADDSAILLELFGKRTNPCFYGIVEGMGRRYAVHHATSVGENLSVDPEKFDRLLSMADDYSR